MKRLALSIIALVGVAGCSETPTPTQEPTLPTSASDAQVLYAHRAPQRSLLDGVQSNSGLMLSSEFFGPPTISYHGGPVIFAQKVATIYWSAGTIFTGGPAPGTMGPGANDGSLVGYFLNHVGGSEYYGINTTYYGSGGTHIQNSVTYTQYWASNTGVPASGTNVSRAALQSKILAGFSSGALTWDPNTVYMVFTDVGVDQNNLFATNACAEHWAFTWGANVVKAAAMPHGFDIAGCRWGAGFGSPNNDPAAEAAITMTSHELEEANTNPQGGAWYDFQNNQIFENADKCLWLSGTIYSVNGGTAYANTNVGGKEFMIQQNWEIGTNQGCANNFAVYTLTLPSQLQVCLNGTSAISATTLDQINNNWSAGTVSWTSSNTSIASVTSTGSRTASVAGVASGQAAITGTLDGATGQSTITVGSCPSVTISGPTTVRPGATCTWFANASGGTPPYTSYAWTPLGDHTFPDELTYTNSGQNFTVSVWVTDSAGLQGYASFSVTVSSSAPICRF